MPRHVEDGECLALMAWASVAPYRDAHVADFLFHYPAGGKRNPREAARFKRMGVRPGIPDYFLHLPKSGWAGLFIEMKTPALNGRRAGTTSEKQDGQLAHLAGCGYRTEVAFGWHEAARVICDYLGIRDPCGSPK